MHKRRIDKSARRDMRNRERETARDQVRQEKEDIRDQQERFRVIHGGREVTPEEAAAFAARIDAQRAASVSEMRDAAAGEVAEVSAESRDTAEIGEDAEVQGDARNADSSAEGAPSRRLTLPEIRTADGDEADQVSSEAPYDGYDDDGPEAESYDEDEYADDEEVAEQPPKKRHRVRRVVLIIVAAIVGVILILLGLFCWNRWLRYDDTAEIQGEWFAAYSGKRAPIVIDGDSIVFNPETTWHYTLDTTAKTITFTFGSQSGGGRYWFVGDHEHLVIEDGIDYSASDTFFADLARTLTGKANEIPQGDSVTVLSRSADALPEPSDGLIDSSPAIGGEGAQAEKTSEAAAGQGAEKADGQSANGEEGEAASNGAPAETSEAGSANAANNNGSADQTEETHA